jgi:RNA-binding protein 5/10
LAPSSSSRHNQTDQANSAAAVAQAALKNMQKKQVLINHLASTMKHQSGGAFGSDTGVVDWPCGFFSFEAASEAYATPPDISTFTYDETSGYYYDSTTGYYYDANSQYFYNPAIQQYMYWDPISGTYIPVAGTSQTQSDTSVLESDPKLVKDAEDSKVKGGDGDVKEMQTTAKDTKSTNKPLNAAQIAKNMEKWAKTMNTKTQKKPATAMPSAATAISQQNKDMASIEPMVLQKKVWSPKSLSLVLAKVQNILRSAAVSRTD